ncbi:hypothetical protein ASPWEDRAFT_312432 [Aspergillus wentii DTO 134E9]|uniref:Uncharacterized protein n=1 Tax=Aspergillus wentii DTO 134E9 TaxID=1073089 RepID=A0A1L9RTC9_ASPWE|nr:uncharacterized protein ASPWEDRAFT_312432 [Aspergillus wentii DTO 134E9]OJJ38175.1 hypothetical protein ASPWEDRAFT_312432 [Aspergillus wentii DTO 134E9]
MEALLRGLDRITYILLRCQLYEAFLLHENRATHNLQLALIDMYALILSFLAKATRVYERNHAQRALAAFWTTSDILHFERECQDLERRAESEAQNCERYLNAAERVKASKAREYLSQLPKMENLQGLITQVDDIWSTLQKQETNEILQWLSKIPYQDHHKTACEGRTAGTGEWIFENESYSLWQRSCQSEIFWLHGIPGAGKTKLTSRVVDRWLKTQTHDNAVAYFYCNYKQESRRDPQKILQSLVKQIAKCPQRDSIHQNTVDVYRRNQNIGGGSAELSFAESEDMLCELAQGYSQVTLILDALDECDQSLRGKLIKAFDLLITRCDRNIKVFISSRRDDDIKRRLENRVNIGLEVTNNTDDINKFVLQRIEDGQDDRRKPICNALKDEIVMTLGEKSQGMFQWAALQIEQILCLGLERDIRLRLGRLPHDLKTAYDEILDRIKSSTGSTPIISMRAFQWVLFSYKPLSPEALVTLISKDSLNDESELSDLDIYFVLDACDNLLLVDEEANICRFSHFSVQEYLQDHHYSPKEPNRIEYAQAELASMAIRCILQTNEGQICGEMLKPIPGMRYAAAYWYRHARVALNAGPHQQLQVLIDQLFSSCYTRAYTNWLDVWNPDSSMRVQGTREFPRPLYYASLLGFQASVEKNAWRGCGCSSRRKVWECICGVSNSLSLQYCKITIGYAT